MKIPGSLARIKQHLERLFKPVTASAHEQRRRAVQQLLDQSHPEAPSFIAPDDFALDDGGIYGNTHQPTDADRIWQQATSGYTSLGRIDTHDGE